jgi:fatty acyl-CoA reductase
MLIYNFTSTVEAPIKWGMFGKNIIKYVNKYPTQSALWYTIFTLKKSKFMYWLSIFFLHWIPAALVDFVAVSSGQKPRYDFVY